MRPHPAHINSHSPRPHPACIGLISVPLPLFLFLSHTPSKVLMCGPPPMIKFACVPNLEKVCWSTWCRKGGLLLEAEKEGVRLLVEGRLLLPSAFFQKGQGCERRRHPLHCGLIVVGLSSPSGFMFLSLLESAVFLFFFLLYVCSPFSLFHIYSDLCFSVCPFSLLSLFLFSLIHLSRGLCRALALYLSLSVSPRSVSTSRSFISSLTLPTSYPQLLCLPSPPPLLQAGYETQAWSEF